MGDCDFEIAEANLWHIQKMLERIENEPALFSPAKLGRWLGYTQGVIVANGYGTLEAMKEINKKNKD